MKSRNLILSVKRGKFRVDDPNAEMANKEYLSLKKQILERDNHTCQFCGFRSGKFQEIHHLDDDHTNNKPENLATTCPICHMCNHISFAGIQNMGLIIHLEPELGMSQASLNCLVRELWMATLSDHNDTKIAAEAMLSRFHQQMVPVARELGDAKPTMLGEKLLKLTDDEYENRESVLRGFYFFPYKEAFVKQIKHWKDESLSKFQTSQWIDNTERKIGTWLESEYGIDGSEENIAKFIKTKETK